MPRVHRLEQVVARFVANLTHNDSVGPMTESCREQLTGRDGNLTGDGIHCFPANRVRLEYLQLGRLLDNAKPLRRWDVVKQCLHERCLA